MKRRSLLIITLSKTLPLAIVGLLLASFAVTNAPAQRRTRRAATSSKPTAQTKSLTIRTEPNAVVYFNDVRLGKTDETGALTIKRVPAGSHTLRIRAIGFRERSVPLPSTRRTSSIDIKLTLITDEAERLFQQAEEAREAATDRAARERALELYDEALKLRPRFPAAHIGRARTLFDLAQYDSALEAVEAARAARPAYPEASVIEGRILRTQGDNDGAIEAYRQALRESRNRQAEAHTGLGIIYEERGEYAQAAEAFRQAVNQLADSEPVIYQLLGSVYEQQEKYKEAVAAYEEYLKLAPDGKLAPAIKSIIEQLKRQAAGEGTLPY